MGEGPFFQEKKPFCVRPKKAGWNRQRTAFHQQCVTGFIPDDFETNGVGDSAAPCRTRLRRGKTFFERKSMVPPHYYSAFFGLAVFVKKG